MSANRSNPVSSARPAAGALGLAHYLGLALLCLLLFAPGITTLPPTDRDEARFVQATKQMVESGDYVDIRFQDEPRYKKPAGIYWLQSAAVAISGQGADAPVAVYRTVSILGATLAVLATAWLGAWMFGTTAGLIAAVSLAGLLMLGFEARIAKTDATLLATGLVAQAMLARIYLGHRAGTPGPGWAPWLFWAAQGAAILIKGPVIPFLSLLTAGFLLAFDRDRAWLTKMRALPGAALMLLVAAPWLALITYKSGAAFWQEAVGRDLLGKIGSGQESHGFPPGYYVLVYSLTMWPFGLATIDAGLRVLNGMRADPRLLFLAAWYLPYWLIIELVPTKLPHYMLPAFPALVLALGWALGDPAARDAPLRRWQSWLRWATAFGLVVVTVALAAIAIGITPYVLGSFSWWGGLAAIVVVVTGWLGSGIRPPLAALPRTLAAALGAGATLALAAIFVLPPLKPVWLSPEIARLFAEHRPCPQGRLVSTGYYEPSLIFLVGTNTLLTDPATAAETLAENPACTLALVRGDLTQAFFAALPAGQASVAARGAVSGINYSKGTPLVLTLYGMAE